MKHVYWCGKPQPPGRTVNTMTEDCSWAYEHVFKPYFQRAINHDTGVNVPYTINIYSDTDFPRYGDKTIDIPIAEISNVHDVFWEYRRPIPDKSSSSPNIKLTLKGVFIGVLCPEDQIIWATDWTHQASLRETTISVISYLAKLGFLKVLELKSYKKVPKSKRANFAISIGGDPEFELVNLDGKVLRARNTEGINLISIHGGVGVDGSGNQVELRPSPGNPEKVVDSIKNLLELFGDNFSEDYRLAASSSTYPCGGHIHIGIEPLPDPEYYSKLSLVLDDFIGIPTAELNGPIRKSDSEYGNTTDWRVQPYGMEYRTPPATVWKNPELTKIVLKLTYNLSQKLANDLELKYTTPVTKRELVRVGGLSHFETIHYLEECKKQPPNEAECLLAAWGIKIKPPKPKVRVTFNQDWHPEVQRLINVAVRSWKVDSDINLIFYGLFPAHGDVYTFPIPSKSIMNHPNKEYSNFHFGFPRRFRMGKMHIPELETAMNCLHNHLLESQLI